MANPLHYHRTILGFHGCDESLLRRVLLEHQPLAPSENDYDWLGRGIYFWEYGPERAFDWACEVARRRPERIRTPAVLGAIIQLGNCFDLLDLRHTRALRQAHAQFVQTLGREESMVPANTRRAKQDADFGLRKLDCAVLNWWLNSWANSQGVPFDTVRGVFQEGDPAFPGSGIRLKSHVQVSVRNPGAVLGYFNPTLETPIDR